MAKLVKMTLEAVDDAIAMLEGWTRQDEKWMQGSYRFVTFPDAIAFVGQIAEIAEELNHHPFIAIDYKKVTLRLTTWHSGGLTELDMQSAQRYNDTYKASITGNG
ncbi:4a-hydroxytetrahydrobiopterin dehydratase [Paenibacillus sp. R14(2021)]|uniref:4a-hydroxytetrahydrobiopterin dehydratase n=1 Tax=Paenibacillus sp. R14(2021) TaxID=2859228 RepID=UPI0021581B53|nr:4a-hydroxytetrahydrobiopterin dehydratase [Paenibacillus sp. R14(2021)]